MKSQLEIFEMALRACIEISHNKALRRIERSRKWRDTGSDKFNEFQFGKMIGMKDAYEHVLQMIEDISNTNKRISDDRGSNV